MEAQTQKKQSPHFQLSAKQSTAWLWMHDPKINTLFFGGGAGSGKTMLGCMYEISCACKYPGTFGLIARQQFVDLQRSTLVDFHQIAAQMGYVQGDHYKYDGQKHWAEWKNGSITFFRQLKAPPGDPEHHFLGSTKYTRAFIDEAPEIEEGVMETLNSRIRYNLSPYGLTPKLLMTGNPGHHWIRKRMLYTDDDKPVQLNPWEKVVLATVMDNPDPEFRAVYIQQLERMTDPTKKARLLHGDWFIRQKTGMEYWHTFDPVRSVKPTTYDPGLPLHITLDFNTRPYMTLLVAQIKKHPESHGEWIVEFLKEYCLPHPRNSTEQVAKAFRYDLEQGDYSGHTAGVFYYGDYSGKKKDTRGSRHDFDILRSTLAGYVGNTSDRVTPNPSHHKSRDFMLLIFDGKLPITLLIDPKMHTTIKDLHELKEGADGTMLKEHEKDKNTGVQWEKYGHASQAMYYLVISAFKNLYKIYDRMPRT